MFENSRVVIAGASGSAMGDDSCDPASDQWDPIVKPVVDNMRNTTTVAFRLARREAPYGHTAALDSLKSWHFPWVKSTIAE